MLVSRRAGGLQLVRHPDHAALAGALAEAWGGAGFEPGPHHNSLVCAATRHDDGWAELDAAPMLAPSGHRPAHFLEVPLDDTIAPYGAGIEKIYEDDAYAGVLASRHWSGLYAARWGVQDSPPVPHPSAVEIARTADDRATSEARQLWQRDPSMLRSAFDALLWRDYEILQALDLLSLALCLIDISTPSTPGSPDIPVPATLAGIDQVAGGRSVPNVPCRDRHVSLGLRVVSPGLVEIDPFPFRRSRFTVTIPTVMLPDDEWSSAEAAIAAYRDAPTTQLELTLAAKAG